MDIKKASKYSIYNILEIKKSDIAGCYNCRAIFKTSEITELNKYWFGLENKLRKYS